jgi:hypothetical protein
MMWAWWKPWTWWRVYKARRAALAAIRKAINAANDLQAADVLWIRQNLVRIVRIEQGRLLHFEVQWRNDIKASWQLQRTSYDHATAESHALALARGHWTAHQPQKVQVIG